MLLSHIDLFHPFDSTELSELARQMEERFFPKGAVVVRRGNSDSLYILVEGALEVEIVRAADRATDLMVPGDVFGEMSLLTGQPRSATVIALTDAVVYEVNKEVLDPILQRRSVVIEKLATIMAQRQAMNAKRVCASDRQQESVPPTREDFLGRVKAFFKLAD